jgi:asparagine synthetase B (glutamine-hydrolysing)
LPRKPRTTGPDTAADGLLRLSPVESAIDTSIGEVVGKPPLPEVDPALDPLTALEEAMIRPLERQPCVVSFSGGRDSSAVLAVAVKVARREGLPLPIPVTYRYPDNPEAEESRWQELVVHHLGLSDWERLCFRDELDLIGPIAQKALRRHGLLSPAGTYTAVPLFESASTGSVLTGVDGDGLFGGWDSARAWAVLTARARPTPRDLRRVLRAAAPKAVRRAWFLRRSPAEIGWLNPSAQQELHASWTDERASQPARWDSRVAWFARRRDEVVFHQALELLADDHQVKISHPFLDPRFLATVARAGGRSGFGDRTRAMRELFDGLLPEAVLARTDKADFTAAIWNESTREFISGWPGGGLPDSLIDESGLRRAWAEPNARTALLLQAAWLWSVDGKLEHLVNCRFE